MYTDYRQDDGSHSVACEKCSVWQHSKCLGISKSAAEKDDFHFVCKDCKRREDDAKKPKISLKFRANPSSSPTAQSPTKQKLAATEVPKKRGPGRPPSKGSIANGHPQGYGSPPTQHKPGISNGYLFYTGPTAPIPHSSQYPPYANGNPFQYQLPSSSGGQSPPTQPKNGYTPRPGSSSTQPYAPLAYQYPPSPNNYPQPPSQYGQHPPYYNGTPHQYQGYQPAPPSLQPTPRPTSSVANMNGVSLPNATRIPSPVLNRPVISPTQGNYDVGPVAGVPQKSSPVYYSQPQFTPSQQTITSRPQYQLNGVNVQSTPTPFSNIPKPNHLSGISPTKHSPTPPLPHPSNIPQMISLSPPPAHASNPTASSVSGNPIFPPAQYLAPSPRQLSESPMPTPSKHSIMGVDPSMNRVGEQELKRVSVEVKTRTEAPVDSHGGGECWSPDSIAWHERCIRTSALTGLESVVFLPVLFKFLAHDCAL